MRKLAVRFSFVHGGETYVTGRVYEKEDEEAARLMKVCRQRAAKLIYPFVDITDSGEEVQAEDFADPHLISRRPRYTEEAKIGRKPKKKKEAEPPAAETPTEEAPVSEEPTTEEVTEETTPEETVESTESAPEVEVTAPTEEEAPKTEE